MKNFLIPILIFFAFIWVLKGITCNSPRARSTHTTVNVSVDSHAKDGLDLEALIELVKKGKSAEDIERKLNKPGSINNLDLDADGKTDFIKVTEYGNKKNAYGFSFTVQLENGEEQEVAEIEIQKDGSNADVVARGNQQIYGHHHHYHSHFPLTTFLLWSYLVTPHPFYMSPYAYGYYPSYYSRYSPVSRSVYNSRVSKMRGSGTTTTRLSANSPKSKSSLNNPNRGKIANSGIKQKLSQPTNTQKKFQARTRSRSVKSGGFGRSKSSSSRKSFSSRGFSSGRSFGGGGK